MVLTPLKKRDSALASAANKAKEFADKGDSQVASQAIEEVFRRLCLGEPSRAHELDLDALHRVPLLDRLQFREPFGR